MTVRDGVEGVKAPDRWSADDARARVPAFVGRTFLWPGTVRLHRAALGPDVVRTPANVFLSPVLVLVRLTGWTCAALRFERAAGWLRSRRILLRTDVSARLETAILQNLLGIGTSQHAVDIRRHGLAPAILAAPELAATFDGLPEPQEARLRADRIAEAIAEYSGTRSAVAELTTALLTLIAGAALFHALTPGMISIAPGVAEALARSTAVAAFPLGEMLGGLWYGVFPARTDPWLVAASLACLMSLGALVTTFAGLLADPLQALLGIHRRRLLRLIDTVEAELCGAGGRPFVAREHFMARVFDLWDAALSLVKALKG
ncbi:DUF6635 family protein [Aquibium microcysteis]|uniref:DUF6635 family protein n=1 Tax=Aquibium microcysteis TaxID=675281 RepID=UPI00165D205F|nr:DUF6635 family protein [Aquibium microcysteis]